MICSFPKFNKGCWTIWAISWSEFCQVFILHTSYTCKQSIHCYFLDFGDWTDKEGWEIGWKRGTAEIGERKGGESKEGERGATEIGEREGEWIPMSQEGRRRQDLER